MIENMDRREFVKASSVVAGGLVVGSLVETTTQAETAGSPRDKYPAHHAFGELRYGPNRILDSRDFPKSTTAIKKALTEHGISGISRWRLELNQYHDEPAHYWVILVLQHRDFPQKNDHCRGFYVSSPLNSDDLNDLDNKILSGLSHSFTQSLSLCCYKDYGYAEVLRGEVSPDRIYENVDFAAWKAIATAKGVIA